MKAVLFQQFGRPEEVLQVGERPTPEPGPGQVRVRMLMSPMNPSDLLYVRGEYGQRPQLPATPGFEGTGVVEASGGGLLGAGSWVGAWQSSTALPATGRNRWSCPRGRRSRCPRSFQTSKRPASS